MYIKKFLLITSLLFTFFLVTSPASAAELSVKMTVNGESENAAVHQGDLLKVRWQSSGAVGCAGSGAIGDFFIGDVDWAQNKDLPTSGERDVLVKNWSSTGVSFTVYCWTEGWKTSAALGQVVNDSVWLMDYRVSAQPTGPTPLISSLSPASGPTGTTVQIRGSGFGTSNSVQFIGSTGTLSGTDDGTASPVSGAVVYNNKVSADGKTLSLLVPTMFPAAGSKMSEGGQVSERAVVPGNYYVVVENTNGKSNPTYFVVTKSGTVPSNLLPRASAVVTQNRGFGELGVEISNLQKYLAKDNSIYPEAKVTGYFGTLTQRAVERFQCKYNIVCSGSVESTGYGYVGPKTRFKLDEIFLSTTP